MEPYRSREQQARRYLEKHRILDLLNQLTSNLIYFQPLKPREYLISILERLRIAKITGVAFPIFIDHTDIVAMFEIMDSSHKGAISFEQYKQALDNLGLWTKDEDSKDDGHGITLEKFKSEVKDTGLGHDNPSYTAALIKGTKGL